VGGAFPLSAASAAEAGPADTGDMASRVGSAFFWQGPGCGAPYVVALLLLCLPRTNGITSIQFRVLLGAGAVPALLVLLPLVSKLYGANAKLANPTAASQERPLEEASRSRLGEILRNPKYRSSLIGCAGCWFLYDVACYGTMIFAPSILVRVFGAQETIVQLCMHAIVMTSLGVAGSLLGLLALPIVGTRVLNTWGFVLMSALFLVFAFMSVFCPEQHFALFGMLCLVMASLYSGPSLGTFILPLEVFPADVRSTSHGICATAGKVGAVVGTLLFPVVDRQFGVPAVMFAQGVVCCMGAVLSAICLGGVSLSGVFPAGHGKVRHGFVKQGTKVPEESDWLVESRDHQDHLMRQREAIVLHEGHA